jgi:hypothetical protein
LAGISPILVGADCAKTIHPAYFDAPSPIEGVAMILNDEVV